MSARAHTTAVLSLMRATGVTVYDGRVPDAPSYPYAVLYPDLGMLTPPMLTNVSCELTMTLYVHAVGTTRDQAQWVAEKIRDALIDVRPAVTGRHLWPIRQDITRPPERDDTLPAVVVFDQVATYRLRSVPASAA